MTRDNLDALLETAADAVRLALAKGAADAAARAYRVRDVSVQWRDGRLEQINEATTRGVGLQLYVEGRYSAVTTSDLRPEALGAFVEDAVAMTRVLEKDPYRTLPEPALYAGRADMDLQVEDPAYADVTPETRRRLAREVEEGARGVDGASAILSVTAGFSDNRSEVARVHSNGFSGARAETSFWAFAETTVKDADGRRPADWDAAGVRYFGELPAAPEIGARAARRALSRIGSAKAESGVLSMAVDNRSAGRLIAALTGPLSGQSLQQKRSFLEGRKGATIGSPLLELLDDPFLPKAFGSRLWDGEGLAAKQLPIFEAGRLANYYIDTYYGKKLGLPPTTGGSSNLVLAPGALSADELLGRMGEGILVTGFLGGNSNATTGDFSLGVQGFRVRGGRAAEPVGEMNISGNLADLWQRLVAVGNDPYPYSSVRVPTLVFDGVHFAGV